MQALLPVQRCSVPSGDLLLKGSWESCNKSTIVRTWEKALSDLGVFNILALKGIT